MPCQMWRTDCSYVHPHGPIETKLLLCNVVSFLVDFGLGHVTCLGSRGSKCDTSRSMAGSCPLGPTFLALSLSAMYSSSLSASGIRYCGQQQLRGEKCLFHLTLLGHRPLQRVVRQELKRGTWSRNPGRMPIADSYVSILYCPVPPAHACALLLYQWMI